MFWECMAVRDTHTHIHYVASVNGWLLHALGTSTSMMSRQGEVSNEVRVCVCVCVCVCACVRAYMDISKPSIQSNCTCTV